LLEIPTIADALIGEVPTERGEPGGDVLDVRAVVTDLRWF
jgi:hypothetical protein